MYRKELKNSIMEVYIPYVNKKQVETETDREAKHREARQATQTGANSPVPEKLWRNENKTRYPEGKQVKKMIQPNLGTFMGMRRGLEGSQRMEKAPKTSGARNPEGAGGRNLQTLTNMGTNGRVGDRRRKERIWAVPQKPGSMDRYLGALKMSKQPTKASTVTAGRQGPRQGRRSNSINQEWTLFEEGLESEQVKERQGIGSRIGLKFQAQGK